MRGTVIELANRRGLDSRPRALVQEAPAASTMEEGIAMIRDPRTRKQSRSMLSVRIPTTLDDRLTIYVASARLNKQDLVEEVLTKHLDEVDPAGKARERALASTAARTPEAERLDRLEGKFDELLEALRPSGRKRARA